MWSLDGLGFKEFSKALHCVPYDDGSKQYYDSITANGLVEWMKASPPPLFLSRSHNVGLAQPANAESEVGYPFIKTQWRILKSTLIAVIIKYQIFIDLRTLYHGIIEWLTIGKISLVPCVPHKTWPSFNDWLRPCDQIGECGFKFRGVETLGHALINLPFDCEGCGWVANWVRAIRESICNPEVNG